MSSALHDQDVPNKPIAWRRPAWSKPGNAITIWPLLQRVIALIALLGLTPLFTVLFFIVRLTSRGPFLYTQSRPGLEGVFFTAYKIRTMTVGADRDRARSMRVDRADPAVTPVGRILRDLKIDELPQLYNIWRGDMALVGPRPIAPALQQEMERAIPGFARRLSVRPGLTSLAQICLLDNGDPDKIVQDWSQRFEAELDYIYHRSPTYDLVIIGLTVAFLLRKIWRRTRKLLGLIAALTLATLMTACTERLSTHSFNEADAAYEKDIQAYGARNDPAVIAIEPISLEAPKQQTADPVYRVGRGDQLAINIFGEEGLDDITVTVDGNGFIQLPFVEHVDVAGRSTAEIQRLLKIRFGKQFLNPWVVVNIAQHRSRPVYLLGKFNKPGVIYLNGPTNLLQVVSMGSGLSEDAHLAGARLWRGGEIAAVDLNALLLGGSTDHNAYLEAGDIVFVPSQSDKKAYILGAVESPGAVPLSNQPMTLLKALAHVGGPRKAEALLSQVRVIRVHSPLEGQLILVNANDMLKGHIPDLQLMPDDIIYVPDNWVENWNEVIRAITPTLQLAGGALQPFVQLKFLKGD